MKEEPVKAMSEETAYLMTNVLKGVLTSNGTSPMVRLQTLTWQVNLDLVHSTILHFTIME